MVGVYRSSQHYQLVAVSTSSMVEPLSFGNSATVVEMVFVMLGGDMEPRTPVLRKTREWEML